jgi:hypothetical protein
MPFCLSRSTPSTARSPVDRAGTGELSPPLNVIPTANEASIERNFDKVVQLGGCIYFDYER